MDVKQENTGTKRPQNDPTSRGRPGVRFLRYTTPPVDRRGDILSPRAEAKRKLRAALEAIAGKPLSPRQVRRLRKALQRDAKAAA